MTTQAIQAAQTSANEETKSSAGDKYETGRAMAQLEIEKNIAQLAEAQRLLITLSQINPEKKTETVQAGSLVLTNIGNYFIAIPAGHFAIDNADYFVISPFSPIAQKMIGLKEKDSFQFMKKDFVIKKIS